MIDVIQLLARYNTHATNEMNKVLSTLSPEEWKRSLGGFYPSIHSVADHLYKSDLAWLTRFHGFRVFRSLQGDLFTWPLPSNQAAFDGYEEYASLRKELNRFFEGFAAEVTSQDLATTLEYRNWRGEEQARNLGGLVLHVFNHQTHHRGMIALYLDQLGKVNDYSGLSVLV